MVVRRWRAALAFPVACIVGGVTGACGDSGRPCAERAALVATCNDEQKFSGCPCEPKEPVAEVCTPNAKLSCYPGPPGTENVGACIAGTQRCYADGAGKTACDGAVVPRINVCGTSADLSCGTQKTCVDDHGFARGFAAGQNPNAATNVGVDDAGRVYVLAGDLGAPGVASPTGTALYGFDAAGRSTFTRDVPAYALGVIGAGGVALLSTASPPCPHVEAGSGVDYLALYGASGKCRWHAKLNDGAPGVSRIAADAHGDLIIVNPSLGTVQKLHGGDGSFAWEVKGSGVAIGAVGTDAASNVYVAGTYTDAADFGTGPIGQGANGVFVAKFAPDGKLLYLRPFIAPAVTMAVAGDGEVALGGVVPPMTQVEFDGARFTPASKPAIYFARLDADGHARVLRRLDVATTQVFVAVAPDGATLFATPAAQTFSFAGVRTVLRKGEVDLLVGRLAADDGEPTWGMTYAAGSGVTLASFTVAPSGAPVLVGTFASELGFATDLLGSSGATLPGFVAKLAP